MTEVFEDTMNVLGINADAKDEKAKVEIRNAKELFNFFDRYAGVKFFSRF